MQTVQYSGVNLAQVDTVPAFALGTIVTVPVSLTDYQSDGSTAQTHKGFSTARYVKAGAALTAEKIYFIDIGNVAGKQAGSASAVNHTNATGKCIRLGVPTVDIASGSYGWVIVSDLVKVSVLASAVQFVPLYTSGTDAVADDASSSQTQISGLHLLSTASAANQSKVGCIVGELRVGA